MILSRFIDKTLDAAKQSALQIYGDDYASLMQMMPDDGENKKQSHNRRHMTNSARSKKRLDADEKSEGGVYFERSFGGSSGQQHKSEQPIESNLESIRKYAAQQGSNTPKSVDATDSTDDAKPAAHDEQAKEHEAKTNKNVYSRRDIRSNGSQKDTKVSQSSKQSDFDELDLNNMAPSTEQKQQVPFDQFVPEFRNGASKSDELSKQDTSNIHQRLDRLESLMHLALSTPDTAHSEHPLYHKMLHKGVSKKLLNQWFEDVVAQGIGPTQQPKLFHSKLLQKIDEQLERSQADPPGKVMLFAGRSGAGKTHLVMKLAGLPTFLPDKKVAVAFFAPKSSYSINKYSILEPFCQDNDIDFYRLENKESAIDLAEWNAYDHVLIDTPSLEIEEESLIKHISTLQDKVSAQATIETHYLVNTAINGTAFNDPLAQEIDADHLALTHIDKSLKWGKTVQLMLNTDYKIRYISSGPSIEGNLLPFKSEKFARKLLRA